MRLVLMQIILLCCCAGNSSAVPNTDSIRKTITVTYNNVSVDVVVDKPALSETDVLMVFHGTVLYDRNILQAANNTLDKFKSILDRKDMMIVSVAYPGEGMLLGDNIRHAEAALLWVKNKADEELGIRVKKIFLAGHSQGGYLVTMLNTLHPVNGVIANAPGPLNLVYRCSLEEKGKIKSSVFCARIREAHGNTETNSGAYMERSLISFTTGYQSDILFVQGLSDSPIHMYTWPKFKQEVMDCSNCKQRLFVEMENAEHGALFKSPEARTAFNDFINSR